jgi:hypothetical protein
MIARHIYLASAILSGLLAVSLTGCGGSVELASVRNDRTIMVDGNLADWQNIPMHTDKNNVTTAVCNDDKYLYLLISSPEREFQMQFIGRGFTVWFDPRGGEEKTLGIHFPLGGRRPQDGSREASSNPEEISRRMLESATELEILGPGKDERYREPVAEEKEVLAKASFSNGTLVYELRVPLRSEGGHPYAIGATGGSPVGVGLEVAVPSEEQMSQWRERAGSSGEGTERPEEGGRGYGQGRGGRGGRGGMPPGSRGRPEPYKLWMNVKLAASSIPRND